MAEYKAAARSEVLDDISTHTTDMAYPLGWAFNIVQCDATECKDACPPK
jgi:hypothetical protein